MLTVHPNLSSHTSKDSCGDRDSHHSSVITSDTFVGKKLCMQTLFCCPSPVHPGIQMASHFRSAWFCTDILSVIKEISHCPGFSPFFRGFSFNFVLILFFFLFFFSLNITVWKENISKYGNIYPEVQTKWDKNRQLMWVSDVLRSDDILEQV